MSSSFKYESDENVKFHNPLIAGELSLFTIKKASLHIAFPRMKLACLSNPFNIL